MKRLICFFKGHKWKCSFKYGMTADYKCQRCDKQDKGWCVNGKPGKLF